MVDRNRTDLNREADLYRQYVLQSRGTESRQSPFIDRDQEEEYKTRVDIKEGSTLLGRVVKMAGIGLGAYALGRTIPKDLWVEALHRMGQYGSRTFGTILQARNRAVAGLIDHRLAPTRTVRGLELSDFLHEEATPLVQELHQSMVHRGAIDYANAATREALQRRFSTGQETTRRLAGLTVNDVLEMSRKRPTDTFKVISQSSIDILQEAKQRLDPKDSWFGNLRVDQHLHRSTYGKLAPSIIRDTRWASRRAVADLAHNSLGFQIPFVGFKPIDLFTPFFRLAGKRKDFVRVGLGQKLARDIKTPDDGVSWLINGELVHFGDSGVRRLAPGRKFRSHKIDGLAEANLAKLGEHPLQKERLRLKKSEPDTFKTFLGRLSDLIGIGTRYRNEPSGLARVIHAGRISRGRHSGSVAWKPYERIRQRDLPFREKLKRQVFAIRRGGQLNEELIIDNPYQSFDSLSFLEKLKAKIGFGRLGEFVNDRGRSIETRGLLGVRADRPSPASYGYRKPKLGEVGLKRSPIRMGEEERIPLGYTIFEDKLSTKASLISHFVTTRLNQLVGFTIGMGFRPSATKWGPIVNAAKLMAIGGIFSPAGGYAVEAVKYVNYLFERATNAFGHLPWEISPLGLGLTAYEGVTLGAAYLKDFTGITSAAKYTEDLLPGSIQSPLSGIARTLTPVLLGGKIAGPRGMAAGLGIAALSGGVSDIFGTDLLGAGLATSGSELSEMYSGERKVRVRSGRWWMLNRSSFYGEGTDRYDPHWVALAKSGAQYTDVQYGSKKEYFQHASRLPTFHNLFGLASDEDYFAKKHYATRPYPEAPSGEKMHVGELLAPAPQLGPGVPAMLAAGYPAYETSTYPIGSKTDLSYKLKESSNNLSEFLGVYKFLGEVVFGQSSTGPVLANASTITDPARGYWDRDIGGIFGMTELLRRYIVKPDDVGPVDIVNTIPNQMPTFLPGVRSMFSTDRSYFKDFTIGDPYTKVKGGEYRLPGSGYESINQLHSGKSGVYDSVDAMLILADIAPYSEAYRYYASKVQRMNLDETWQGKVDRAIQHVEEIRKGFASDFRERRFTRDSLQDLEQINEEIKYSAAESFIGAQYERLTLDILPEIGRIVPFGTLLTHKLFPHHTAEQDYLERRVYGSRFSDWKDPIEGFVKPKMITLYNENPLTAAAGGALIGLTATTPFGMMARGGAFAVGLGGMSAIRAGYHQRLEGGYKPGSRENEERVLEYFDKLEYLRYEKAINRAEMSGNQNAIRQLKNLQSRRTMVGLDYSNIQEPRGAIPRVERYYYEAFANAPKEDREKILDIVPRYMQDIYKAKWEPGSIMRDANATMAEFMRHNQTPDENWEGWNLGVQKWQIMSRTMDTADNSIAIDMHRQHISTQMMAQARMQTPNVGLSFNPTLSEESSEWHAATIESQTLRKEAMINGFSNINIAPVMSRGTDSVNYRWRVHRDKRQETKERLAAIVR